MKSDREFIDGIYELAEQRKKEPNLYFKSGRRTAVGVIAAAASLLIVSGIAGGLAKIKVGEDTGGQEIARQNARELIPPEEITVEGKVLDVLESYMGYQGIRIEVNPETSEMIPSKTLELRYLGEIPHYQVGDYMRATLNRQTIGTQEYYVIVDEREMNNEKEFN